MLAGFVSNRFVAWKKARDKECGRPVHGMVRVQNLCASLLLLAYLSARAGGALIVRSGPLQLVGLELPTSHMRFSTVGLTASGVLALTDESDWSYASCPGQFCPTYVGSRDLRGLLVVHTGINLASCSFECHARAAEALGVGGWVLWRPVTLLFDAVPGLSRHFWWAGDTLKGGGLRMPTADITHRSAIELIDVVRRGNEEIYADLVADESPYDRVWGSAAFAFWRVALILQFAWLIELSLCRLWAFILSDGGVRASIAQLVLMLEALIAIERAAFVAIDPLHATGLLTVPAANMLASAHIAGSVITHALFLGAAQRSAVCASEAVRSTFCLTGHH